MRQRTAERRTLVGPEQTVTDRVLDNPVETALTALGSKFQTVLLLIDVDQLTYTEVAELPDIPVGTVMSRLSRARDRVRTHLRSNPNSGEADDVLDPRRC